MMAIITDRPLAVVTGASSGIGREFARQFAENGRITEVAASLSTREASARGPGGPVDVPRRRGALRGGAGGRPSGRGRRDQRRVGVGGDFARQTDLSAEPRMINLNVTSSVHLAKRMVADMTARDSGRLLFTSSIAAVTPGPYEAVYAASKAFLRSFTHTRGGTYPQLTHSIE